MATVQVETNVQWKVFRAAGGNWIGVCDSLRLTLQSETYAELMEDIGLALDGMLRDLFETADLDRFLRDHGWRLVGRVPETKEEVRFDVPFFLLPGNLSGQARNLHQ
jgi:hypothetical protein